MHLDVLRRFGSTGWGVGLVSAALAAALVAVGWADYASTTREFDGLVRAQAASARDTVAAAARANRAAAAEAREQLGERLLDNARLLAELDRLRPLTAAALEDVASRNHLFRITTLRADGSREHFVSPEWSGRGPGPGYGAAGAGTGGQVLIDRLLTGGEDEAVTEVHEGRRPGAARLAAGVRRPNGGAILLSVDATGVANLQRQSSLDALLADIVRSTDDIAYVVFEDAGVQRAQGDVPPGLTAVADVTAAAERRITVGRRPILELGGPIDVGGSRSAHLRVGMRLDRLHVARRRTALRLVVSLLSAAALGVLALGLLWVRRRFGALSAEHAVAQAALRRRDRLSAMGELASTVAHEIRNPLNAIAMSAQRLRIECVDDESLGTNREDARELVDVIQEESQRINTKVQQFLEYARPPALNVAPVDLAGWIETAANAMRPVAASRGVELTTRATAATVLADAEQLRQALDNLLLNAIEATPGDGRVSLTASATASGLTVEVRDTGAGIDPEILPKIFDLYFTTKGSGTGVGLAVAQQIVSAHGGTIEVESAPGAGTTMRIRVPAAGAFAHA